MTASLVERHDAAIHHCDACGSWVYGHRPCGTCARDAEHTSHAGAS